MFVGFVVQNTRLTCVPAKTAALICVSTDVTASRARVATNHLLYLVTRSLSAAVLELPMQYTMQSEVDE